MKLTKDIYTGSLSLLTDLYQLTMAYGYWKEGIADREGIFNLYFRENPFNGGYTICCGLEYVIDFLLNFKFSDSDLEFLATVRSPAGTPMFEKAFLDYLSNMKFSGSLDAIPEGRVVFPQQPLIRVQGPIIQAQLLESALLNMINFQSLVATKAARISHAARGGEILEFGLRRAQGIDGALSASRAAFIGGCYATSNVLAGKVFGIPLAGTHAHSWVMAYPSEMEAFRAYADALPDNCIFLIDTYDTLKGTMNAIEVGKVLKSQGKTLLGVRIDSGDLAYFSTKVRELLDSNGFRETKIVASNDLDEHLVSSLNQQQSAIDIWGIGTKLVTAFDQPALGGVYKLAAIKNGTEWDYKIKLSEQSMKINIPGKQQVRRYTLHGKFAGDMIYLDGAELDNDHTIVDPIDHTRRKKIKVHNYQFEDLLVPVFRAGDLVYQLPELSEIKARVQDELSKLDESVKRLVNPHQYSAGIEQSLFDLRTSLIFKLRER